MQKSGRSTGQHLQDNVPAQWVSDDSWENIQEEFEPTEGEDQITLLETFQQNKLEDVKVNVTEWITSSIRQRVKLEELNQKLMMNTLSHTSWLVYQRSMPAWLIKQR